MSEAVIKRKGSRTSTSAPSLGHVSSADESSKEDTAGEFLDVDMGRIIRKGSLTQRSREFKQGETSSVVAMDSSSVSETELEWPELPLAITEMDEGVLAEKNSATEIKVDVGTSVVPQLKTGYLEANAIDSVTHNATQCYISGDTAVGILNFIEGFLVKAGAKIAPKGLHLHVLEASIFNEHQICSFTVAVRMCNKHSHCYDTDDSAYYITPAPPSNSNEPCHILHFGLRDGDKDQFYCLYYRALDALLSSGRTVHERFQDGFQLSKPSPSINLYDVGGNESGQQPLGISGPPPFPSELERSSSMGGTRNISNVLASQPPLADVLHDMLVGDGDHMLFEGTRMSSLLSSQHWGRSCICASGDNSLKSLMYFLVCLAEDVILRSREGERGEEGAPVVEMSSFVADGTSRHVSCLGAQSRPRLAKHHDSFAALFAMRAIYSLVRDSRCLALVDGHIFESLLSICSFTIFLPSSIYPVDGDAGGAASRYWEDWACIEAQMKGALTVERICRAAQASVIDEKVFLTKESSTRYELLKAIALCSSPELAPYLSRMLDAWQNLLSKRRAVRELTDMKIIPAPYVAVVRGGGTTRELPRPVEFRVRGEFPTLFARISHFLSTLDYSQWDDGRFTSKLHAEVELQPPRPLWEVTLYTASQYCELNILIRHSSDSEMIREYLVQFHLKSGGKVEFYLFINRLLQWVHEQTDLMVPNLEGIESSKEGLILLNSPPYVPYSTTTLDQLSLSDGGPYFDADDSAENLFAAISGSNESLCDATTRLLLGDKDSTKFQGVRLASYLTANQSTREMLFSCPESEIVRLIEALVYVAFQKGDDSGIVNWTVRKPDDVLKYRRLFEILALSQMVGPPPNRDFKACNALSNTIISIEQVKDCAIAVARTRGSAEALQNVLFCNRSGHQDQDQAV